MSCRVLIVDDHPAFHSVARALLDAEGYEVVGVAETGVRGLRAARELAPDVVLVDIGLPDFDGFEVAERLARMEPRPVVVLISSRDGEDFTRLVGRSSARGFIAKSDLSRERIAELLG